MQSYFVKKNEFEILFKNSKSKQLKLNYKKCLDLTEECFALYTDFYNVLRDFLDGLIELYSGIDDRAKIETQNAVEQYNKAKEIYDKQLNTKDSMFSEFLGSTKLAEMAANASINLVNAAQNQRNTARDLANYQAELLSILLKEVFDILFLTISRMDKSNADRKAIKEFLCFTAGLIPIFGPVASGLIAIVNTLNSRKSSVDSADEVLSYLETYSYATDVWIALTNGYIEMLKEWKRSLSDEKYEK